MHNNICERFLRKAKYNNAILYYLKCKCFMTTNLKIVELCNCAGFGCWVLSTIGVPQ